MDKRYTMTEDKLRHTDLSIVVRTKYTKKGKNSDESECKNINLRDLRMTAYFYISLI